jgi:tetratricopeptide (TPR) repeat protein
VIAAALLAACLAASQEEPPIVGDCSSDPDALAGEARDWLADLSANPSADEISRARDLLRRARRLAPSASLALFAADLAFAAGDVEEGGDLLAEAADSGPSGLSPPELLLIARRAEERRRWRDAIARYEDLARALSARGERAAWIEPRLSELEVEAQAEAIAAPSSRPSLEARLALADAKRALAAGRLREARERARRALDLSPSYVEALLALGAVETRAGRAGAAIRAYRSALAADPGRFEALAALANLLWEEPDRRAKEESLALIDRAAALRPDLPSLLRLSAERWAEFGDASRALERLDRYRGRASAREREETDALRQALERRAGGAAEETATAPEPEEPASAAVERWKKAQVYFERGDAASLSAAAALLAEAERLDPSLARAPELAAAIHERRGERDEAEAALRRAIRADPARASTFESLARLVEADHNRTREAEDAWRKAADAGSADALLHLARSAEEAGRRAQALDLYRRYRAEAPAGLGAAEAARSVERLESRGRRTLVAAAAGLLLVLAAAGAALWRRRSGSTFSEWLARDPASARRARPVVGRLRHEVLKHGRMLLSDGAARLSEGDPEARRSAALLLIGRLYGEPGSRGLLAETESALTELQAIAREGDVRLNLAYRDPVFARLLRGMRTLRAAERDLRRIAESPAAPGRSAARATRLLQRAARSLALASGAELERALDRAAALPVRFDSLRALLSRVAGEKRVEAPSLELIGASSCDGGNCVVRCPALDWETIWRNLFANALSGNSPGVRLGLGVEKRRDAVTGEARVRLILADERPGALTTGEIRARGAERGWGVVAELLRRNDGSIAVTAPPAPGFTKGIAIELPAIEAPA